MPWGCFFVFLFLSLFLFDYANPSFLLCWFISPIPDLQRCTELLFIILCKRSKGKTNYTLIAGTPKRVTCFYLVAIPELLWISTVVLWVAHPSSWIYLSTRDKKGHSSIELTFFPFLLFRSDITPSILEYWTLLQLKGFGIPLFSSSFVASLLF